ncbi:ABC transporter substrate-binding protein [Streptomyces sp. NPDC007088]|uniref:ABC transporter substrate-binding protein n=1 Tax=Streptomyces sp. NPDC007088 TaxID=3364773 RepID=UPI00367CCD48
MSFSRRNFLISTGVAAGGAMVLSACGSDDSGSGGGGSKSKGPSVSGSKASTVAVGTKADSTGPAPEIAGAKKGGTIYITDRDDFPHLDPQRIYYAYTQAAMIPLHRGLTGYKTDTKGVSILVGDLATDAGTVTDGGKTWKFTLKDGLKWQDGKPVTTEDVKWSFERGFADFTTEGPTYVETWLEGGAKYKGPEKGKRIASVEVDGQDITFTLQEAHADFNFALAMMGYCIVPKKHDTQEKYDKLPFSCGPYMIKSHTTDKSLVMVRNPHWDAKLDPIRNNYPDRYDFTFGFQALTTTDRFIADSGKDQYAVTLLNEVAPERIQKVMTDPNLKKRVTSHIGAGTYYWAINMTRITDLEVRKALNYAWPNQQIRQLRGGPATSEIASTVLSPLIAGREDFDLYGKLKKPAGDPEKAKETLKKAGKLGQKIVFAFPRSDVQMKVSVAIVNALKKAGFDPVAKAIDSTSYYDEIGQLDNKFDVMSGGWVADWPTGYTALQPCFDSKEVRNMGNNWPQLKDASVDKAIAAATAETDPKAAGKAWAAVDRKIMEQAVVVPDYYPLRNYMHGSKVGNHTYDGAYDCPALHKMYAM